MHAATFVFLRRTQFGSGTCRPCVFLRGVPLPNLGRAGDLATSLRAVIGSSSTDRGVPPLRGYFSHDGLGCRLEDIQCNIDSNSIKGSKVHRAILGMYGEGGVPN